MADKKFHDECNCEHDHDECACDCESDDVVVLQDEDGNDVTFHYVYNCTHEGKEYVFLQAAEDDDESLEIFSFETVKKGDDFYDVLDPVDDDLYSILYDKLLLAASEDCCEDGDCHCHEDHCDCDCDHTEKK